MCRSIVRRCQPRLTEFPLAKGGTTYPFRLAGIPALLYVRGKTLVQTPYKDSSKGELLLALKEFVMDMAGSTIVRTCAAYEHEWIANTLDRYYSGDRTYGNAVDWWVTFELWRQSLG
jgi:hypothetical protein